MTDKFTPFCYAPWTTVSYGGIFGGGGTAPCCEWKGTRFTGDVKDYDSSEYLENIKNAMANHDMKMIQKTCEECIIAEKHGNKSARNYIERDITTPNVHTRYEIGKLNKLDYRPDNLCNLKCRMCSMHSSSLIEEEFVANGYDPIEQRDTTDVMDFDLSNLKKLAILGGEPTVNKKTFPILDYLIENNMNETTKLNYTTNCTSINKPWMSRIEKFKNVHINLSIDAAGKAYEYIRTGAEWKKVKNNIPKIISLAEDYSIAMVVQTTSFAIIEDWFEYFLQFPTESINMSPMYGMPGRLDCIPNHIKQQKINYLKKLNHPTAEKAIKHFKMHTYNPNEVRKYKHYNEWLDSLRGTSIYDLDPIFGEIFEAVL